METNTERRGRQANTDLSKRRRKGMAEESGSVWENTDMSSNKLWICGLDSTEC